MAAFRVGQRVKKVRGERNIGLTGVIAELKAWPDGTMVASLATPGRVFKANGTHDCRLLVDAPFVNDFGDTCPEGECFGRTQQWEPIQPECMKPASWSDCLWQPEHMRATS